VIAAPSPRRPRGSNLVREREWPVGRATTAADAGRVGTWVTDRGLAWVAVSRPWHADSAIRGSGDGGLARRAITTATAVAVPAVVATAMIAVAVLLVVLVPVATVAAVAITGWARRRGGWCHGCWGRSIGVEHRWGSRMICTIHVVLLQ
jgi:hypothetical protein